jgi:regulatory protein
MARPPKIDLQDPLERARAQALRLLTARNRSTRELRRRLAQAGHAEEVVSGLLTRLADTGLLDDRRFAEERVRVLVEEKGCGPRKVRSDLFQRGIAGAIVDQVIEQAFQGRSNDSVMRALVRRRFGEEAFSSEADPKLRQRAQRFLLTRGFEPDEVFSLFRA